MLPESELAPEFRPEIWNPSGTPRIVFSGHKATQKVGIRYCDVARKAQDDLGPGGKLEAANGRCRPREEPRLLRKYSDWFILTAAFTTKVENRGNDILLVKTDELRERPREILVHRSPFAMRAGIGVRDDYYCTSGGFRRLRMRSGRDG